MKTEMNISIEFENGQIPYSGAFNAYSVRVVDNLILFAFILKDINGVILSSRSFSVFIDTIDQNRDSFWRYLSARKENTADFNQPSFVFSDIRDIEIIHANTNGSMNEITLGAFSLFHMSKWADAEKIKKGTSHVYNGASIVATFKSSAVVHNSFIKKLLDELEANRTQKAKI